MYGATNVYVAVCEGPVIANTPAVSGDPAALNLASVVVPVRVCVAKANDGFAFIGLAHTLVRLQFKEDHSFTAFRTFYDVCHDSPPLCLLRRHVGAVDWAARCPSNRC